MNADQPVDAAGAPKLPRFVCTVCYRTATTDAAGECPCASAPRLPVDNPEVVEMVRARVASVRQRRMAWKVGLAVVASVTISLSTCYALGWGIDPATTGSVRGRNSPFVWIAFALFVVTSGAIAYLDRAPPSDIQSLLGWLRVQIDP